MGDTTYFLVGVERCISNSFLSGVERFILDSMNHGLTSMFTMKEIYMALKGMNLKKALGADGFLALFFEKLWYIIGEEVSSYCLEVLNMTKSLELLN